ncbi:hypothetical protein ZEAMMB73_Zm00001d050950 [Zea mays]|uniref:Uncharacterized protein n=1 Tax=Zea mays TaxID=4577 RepID=A0A1D6Q415_MAIZE|nr:hypothetical protein ZEAMMB73_Zm00001d050950 [Zea mays]AQK53300.1 hypothetical protein ZEAMMB73_Zm00001d050950 [Zea mays]
MWPPHGSFISGIRSRVVASPRSTVVMLSRPLSGAPSPPRLRPPQETTEALTNSTTTEGARVCRRPDPLCWRAASVRRGRGVVVGAVGARVRVRGRRCRHAVVSDSGGSARASLVVGRFCVRMKGGYGWSREACNGQHALYWHNEC